MLSSYNLERQKYYGKLKSIVIIPVIGNLILLMVGIIISFGVSFTDMKLWFILFVALLVILLFFFIIIYIIFAIGIYRNFQVFKQNISLNNIMDNSNEIIEDFLGKKNGTTYRMLGIYETDQLIIIEFSPYRLRNKTDKYKPIIAMMGKTAADSTWQNIVESNDAMRRLKELREFAQKNEASKLRYLGNQVYYFSHVAENV